MKNCKTCGLPKQYSDFRTGRSECKSCENKKRVERKNKQKVTDETYYDKQRGYDNKRKKIKRESGDEFFNFKESIRGSIRKSFTRMGYNKDSNTRVILGEDWNVVKSYFENKFTDGMTWDNQGEWHIDHIIPLSTATNEQELIKLCHYTNLQPLWAIDNLKKGNKIL